jgi:hypothetical protein
MFNKVRTIIDLALTCFVGYLSILNVFEPTLQHIALMISAIGWMVIINNARINTLSFFQSVKQEMSSLKLQGEVLAEIKNANVKTKEFIGAQADMLSKMTDIAVKKQDESNR